MFSIVVMALIAINFAQSAYCISQCPDINPVQNFDMAAYGSNTWYEIARYSNPYILNNKCVVYETSFDGEAVWAKSHKISRDSSLYLEAKAIFSPDAVGSGKLLSSITYGLPRTTVDIPINVLSIDYERYVIFYSCILDEVTKTPIDYAWIFARTKKLEESEKAIIAEFVKLKIIDEGKLIWTDNSDESCKSIF